MLSYVEVKKESLKLSIPADVRVFATEAIGETLPSRATLNSSTITVSVADRNFFLIGIRDKNKNRYREVTEAEREAFLSAFGSINLGLFSQEYINTLISEQNEILF